MNKQIKTGVILQYIQMAISIIINLVYTPIMIRILGDTEYGIYNLVSSIISYLGLLSLGFGASYIRFYSKYKSDNDEDKISKLNGLYIIVFTIIGIIALTCGLVIANNVEIFFNETYVDSDLKIASVLMVFLAINLSISFPASLFTSYVTSQERFIFQKLMNVGKTVISPCLSIALLFLGYGSIGMVIVSTVISIIVDVINIGYCFTKLKMKFCFKNIDISLLKDIFAFSIFIAINQIIDQINWQTDKIILGKMMNGTAVAIYSAGSTINTMYVQFSTAVSSVFTPKIHKIVNENTQDTDERLTSLFIKVGRVQFIILILILTGFILFGKFFILKWAGTGYEETYYIVLLLICPATISLIQNIGIEIQRAKNMHKFRSIVYLFMALINVGISIWFCSMWGGIGCAIGTAISLILSNGIIMNIYYHKVIKINIVAFWKEIFKITPGLIVPICFGIVVSFINYTKVWEFGILIILYSLVYMLSMYHMGMNKEEKNQIKKVLSKVNFKHNK